MLIPSGVSQWFARNTSLSRGMNANSQLSKGMHSANGKSIKRDEC